MTPEADAPRAGPSPHVTPSRHVTPSSHTGPSLDAGRSLPAAAASRAAAAPQVAPASHAAAASQRRPLDRVGPNDLTYLRGDDRAPWNVAAILVLAPPVTDPARVVAELAARVGTVPRLRQRLEDVPLGCGRPVWVDDPDFAIARHVRTVVAPPPGDEQVLLELASAAVVEPLVRDRPLWAATLVTGLADGGGALLIVLHHVLTDGIGGLAVLAALTADVAPPNRTPFPRSRPSARELRADAWRSRVAGFRTVRRLPATLWAAIQELAPRQLRDTGRRPDTSPPVRTDLDGATGARRPRGPRLARRPARRPARRSTAPRCSLNARTGRQRQAAAISVPLEPVRAAARAVGATVNDALLTAIAGALEAELRRRGETVDRLIASVPISRRRSTTQAALGNEAGTMPVVLPLSIGDPDERLRAIAAGTRRQKGPSRGASLVVLQPLFRLLAAVGLWQPLIDRQRLVNTFVSNLRGPRDPLRFAGHDVTRIVPIGQVAGNVAVAFTVLSYAGDLTVTVVTDPEVVAAPAAIAADLQRELMALCRPAQ
jgi:diacylglycerol O-acyltransferase / wax synthase